MYSHTCGQIFNQQQTRTKDKSGHEPNTPKQSSFSKKGKTYLKRRSLIWIETPSNCYVWSNLARTRLAKTKNSFISSPPGVVNNCFIFFANENQWNRRLRNFASGGKRTHAFKWVTLSPGGDTVSCFIRSWRMYIGHEADDTNENRR